MFMINTYDFKNVVCLLRVMNPKQPVKLPNNAPVYFFPGCLKSAIVAKVMVVLVQVTFHGIGGKVNDMTHRVAYKSNMVAIKEKCKRRHIHRKALTLILTDNMSSMPQPPEVTAEYHFNNSSETLRLMH